MPVHGAGASVPSKCLWFSLPGCRFMLGTVFCGHLSIRGGTVLGKPQTFCSKTLEEKHHVKREHNSKFLP